MGIIKEFIYNCAASGYSVKDVKESIIKEFNFVKIDFNDELYSEYLCGKAEYETIISSALSGI